MITAVSPLKFAAKFVLSFTLLMAAFEASRGSGFERFVVESLILVPATAVIEFVTPAEDVRLQGRTIASAGARLHVTRGCEGVEMLLLLAAGIIAYPASFRRRSQGLLLGCLLAYSLSIGRLIILYYALRYSPGSWEFLHGLILPLGPIILIALYFLRWSDTSGIASHAR